MTKIVCKEKAGRVIFNGSIVEIYSNSGTLGTLDLKNKVINTFTGKDSDHFTLAMENVIHTEYVNNPNDLSLEILSGLRNRNATVISERVFLADCVKVAFKPLEPGDWRLKSIFTCLITGLKVTQIPKGFVKFVNKQLEKDDSFSSWYELRDAWSDYLLEDTIISCYNNENLDKIIPLDAFKKVFRIFRRSIPEHRYSRYFDYMEEENKDLQVLNIIPSYIKFLNMLDKEGILMIDYPSSFDVVSKENRERPDLGFGVEYTESDYDSMINYLGTKDKDSPIVYNSFWELFKNENCNNTIEDILYHYLRKAKRYRQSFAYLNKPVDYHNYYKSYRNNMREYSEKLKNAIDNSREERINNKLREIMTEKNLEFENDEFKIVVPTTVKELMNESNEMKNCVFILHSESILAGNEKIVFLRRKSDLEKSYVTLTAFYNGRYSVSEVLKAKNQRLDSYSDGNAKKFLSLYADYLKTLNK